MYINYVNDRKSLGYKCLVDTQCGNRLVLITDSSVVFVKNVTLNGKRKIFLIIAVMIISFRLKRSAVFSILLCNRGHLAPKKIHFSGQFLSLSLSDQKIQFKVQSKLENQKLTFRR